MVSKQDPSYFSNVLNFFQEVGHKSHFVLAGMFQFSFILVACSNRLKQNIKNKIEPQHTPQIVTNTINPL